MVDYTKLDDDELIDLLYTEEDRLTRQAVDEFIRRRERMVEPLSEIVSERYSWKRDVSEWWAVVHAVYILGAIGGKETVLPLVRAARWAVAYDCDLVTEELPSIFGKVGIAAVDLLKYVSSDRTSDWYTRGTAMDGLAAITIYNPEVEKDIFQFIHSILKDNNESRETKQTAGNILVNFLRCEYKDDLLDFGREERALKEDDIDYLHSFDEDDVEEWFSDGEKDIWMYTKDWLSFYDEDEIGKRQERWNKEIEENARVISSGAEPYIRERYIGRNDPCYCGSGKKYKKCCMGKGEKTLH